MSVLLISIAVIGATIMWPLNRWVVRHGGTIEAYSFWLSLTSALASGGMALATGQSLRQPLVWGIGIIIGIAFAAGYCLVIMYCLRIGPVGPTVAMNNMGLLWPVVAGALWLKPHPLNWGTMAGIAMIALSLICFGFSCKGQESKALTFRWLVWASLGWVLAGISMTSQLLASIYAPHSPFAVIFAFSATAAGILSFFVMRQPKAWLRQKEILAGIIAGINSMIVGAAVLVALRHLNPEIVFPFTVAGPAVLVLMLGQFVYHERLDCIGWLACILGIVGLVELSLT